MIFYGHETCTVLEDNLYILGVFEDGQGRMDTTSEAAGFSCCSDANSINVHYLHAGIPVKFRRKRTFYTLPPNEPKPFDNEILVTNVRLFCWLNLIIAGWMEPAMWAHEL